MIIGNRILHRPRGRKASFAYQCRIALRTRRSSEEAFVYRHYVQTWIAPSAALSRTMGGGRWSPAHRLF